MPYMEKLYPLEFSVYVVYTTTLRNSNLGNKSSQWRDQDVMSATKILKGLSLRKWI